MAFIPPTAFVSAAGRSVTIRCAEPDDAADLLVYLAEVIEGSEVFVIQADELPAGEEQERDWVRQRCERPGAVVLLAVADGRIVGCLSFENGSYRRAEHCGTLGVSVLPQWRGQGIGAALLRTLLRWAEEEPLIEKVCLSVFSNNPRAIDLYRRLGFVEEGRRPRQIKLAPGRYADEVLMGKFVHGSEND